MSSDPLSSWKALNDAVRAMGEADCAVLLNREQRGSARKMFINRIYCRMSRVRRDREHRELGLNERAVGQVR